MDTYAYKTVQCPKCSVKTLIESSNQLPCSNCGVILNKPKPRRNLSEKKPAMKIVQKAKSKVKEEKKKPKKLKPEKKTKDSIKAKNKEIAPQVKKTKKKKIRRPRQSPQEPQYIDFYSDDLPNEGYFSDSFEEFYVDSPVFGFNPIYLAHPQIARNSINRDFLNRVSQNLFSMFFDGFAEIEYIPHLTAFHNDSETFTIGDLLRNLAAMHPDQASPTDPDVVAQIPVIRVTEKVKRESGACTICQEDFKLNETVKKLRCGHIYHGNCLDPWLGAKNTCPVCREVIC